MMISQQNDGLSGAFEKSHNVQKFVVFHEKMMKKNNFLTQKTTQKTQNIQFFNTYLIENMVPKSALYSTMQPGIG